MTFRAMQVVSHEPLSRLWEGYREPAAWLVLVWSAVGPGALAAYLQTQVGRLPPAPHIMPRSTPCCKRFWRCMMFDTAGI